jgi:hypothetical protein
MKIILTVLLLIGVMIVKGQSTPATTVANHIAQKMKDTLGLSDSQKEQLYQINMQLHEAKMAKRQQYAGSDSLRLRLQWVENTRDSLYRTVLNEEKYQLYIEKKKTLVSNQ